MKVVIRFKTDDGKIFKCEQDAHEHEKVKTTQLETIGYYLNVSGLWHKTTKEAYEMCSDNGFSKVRVNLEYWDESMELLNSSMNTDEAIKEVEKYIKETLC